MNGTNRLSDRAMVTDLLNSEKFAASIAGQSALESASPFIRRDFESIGRDCSDNVDIVFRLMSARGWYSPQPASPQAINQSQQEIWSTLSSIGTSASSSIGTSNAMTIGVGPGSYGPTAGSPITRR